MANTKVTQHVIANNAITADQLASAAVTDAKLHATLDLSGKTLTLPATAIPSASTATTQAASDNSTKLATTAYVTTALANLVDSSPSSLNTLNELAAALNDDASFSTTVTNSIATKLPLAGGTLTGALTLSGAPTNALHPATKTYTDTADALKLNLSGGTLTGDLILNTTTALQIPAGTTGQRPSAATAQIRWNTTDGALEVYNGSAWTAVGTGSSNKILDTFTGDGSTTTFTLSVTPANEDAIMVFIDGAYQEKGDYVLTNNSLALDTAPLSAEKIAVHITTAAVHDGTTAVNQQFTATAGQTAFTLSQDPKSENNTHVYINGVYQQKTDYTVVGTTLTFDTGVAVGDIVEVNMFTVATLGNTDTVTEGVGNLYHTTARARAAISAGTGLSYNSSTGVITNTSTGPSGYTSSGDDITLSADADNNASNTAIKFELDGSEMARFTKSSDGGLLFGQQSAYSTYSFGAADAVQIMSNRIMASSNASTSGIFSRYTNSGGDVLDFRRGSTGLVGYIGITNDSTATQAGLYIGGGVIQETTIRLEGTAKAVTPGSGSARNRSNNTTDLGLSDGRWKDFYIAGNAHIGTMNTARKLGIKSGSRNGSSFAIEDASSTAEFVRIGQQSDGDGYLQLRTVAGGGPVLFDASGDSYITGGNVGIGTSSPGRLLTLFNNDQPVFQITNNTSGTASTRGLIMYQMSGTYVTAIDNQGQGSGGEVRFLAAGTEKLRIDPSASAGHLQMGAFGVTGLNTTAAIHGAGNDATLVVSNGNLSGNNASYGWAGRGARYLHSNGTGWVGDGSDPAIVVGSSNSGSNRSGIGIALHNDSPNDDQYSPMIVFGNKSNSGSYNTAYAAIVGKKTGQGQDANWSSGEIHMDTAGTRSGSNTRTAYMDDDPAFKIDNAGDITMPYRSYAYGQWSGSSFSVTNGTGFVMTVLRSQNMTYQNDANHGWGMTVTKPGLYMMNATGLYDPGGTYIYVGWAVNGAHIHHWHSNHAIANNHDYVSLAMRQLNSGDHITFENGSQVMTTAWGGSHSSWYITKFG